MSITKDVKSSFMLITIRLRITSNADHRRQFHSSRVEVDYYVMDTNGSINGIRVPSMVLTNTIVHFEKNRIPILEHVKPYIHGLFKYGMYAKLIIDIV